MKIPGNIIISRTDSIGDVVLTLPVAAVLKQRFPQMKIFFMGKAYTRPVIEACAFVDLFIDVEDFLHTDINLLGNRPEAILHVFPTPDIAKRAKQLRIPLRIGTTNRIYHWFTCNKLVKVTRKRSSLHEAQLNLKLLQPLGITDNFQLNEIGKLSGLTNIIPLSPHLAALIDPGRYNLILHPKSQGNGREWPLAQFIRLVQTLDLTRYKIFVSGTLQEKEALQPLLEQAGTRVTDITGQMPLTQFISFINSCDGLIASGTGPLHIAAALGKDALGIFPPIRPVHPGRWKPIGKKAKVFVLDKDCNDCKYNSAACICISSIEPLWIKNELDKISAI